MEMLKLLYLSVAVGTITLTISRAKIMAGIRHYLNEHTVIIGKLISCPYCLSHWISLLVTMVYFPRVIHSRIVAVDFFISVMVMTAFAALTIWVVFTCHSQIPEANDDD